MNDPASTNIKSPNIKQICNLQKFSLAKTLNAYQTPQACTHMSTDTVTMAIHLFLPSSWLMLGDAEEAAQMMHPACLSEQI